MIPVQSSSLKSIGYDPATHQLLIVFHSGSSYRFSNVPEQKYRALMQAASKGSYFSHNIKEQYPTYKIR